MEVYLSFKDQGFFCIIGHFFGLLPKDVKVLHSMDREKKIVCVDVRERERESERQRETHTHTHSKKMRKEERETLKVSSYTES